MLNIENKLPIKTKTTNTMKIKKNGGLWWFLKKGINDIAVIENNIINIENEHIGNNIVSVCFNSMEKLILII